jgi:hypothetical protein
VNTWTLSLFKSLILHLREIVTSQKITVTSPRFFGTWSRFFTEVPMPQAMDRSFKTDLLADEPISDSFSMPSPSSASASTERQALHDHEEHQHEVQHEAQHKIHDGLAARPNTGDRRQPRDDRRDNNDRRAKSLRRGRDRQRNTAANQIAYLGTMLCALSVGLAIYAFLKPPITLTPSLQCAEGFGGQQVERRGLSSLWAVAMVLAAAGLVIPDRKRRPVVLMVLCGVSVGLFAAAYFTVGTKLVGFCID